MSANPVFLEHFVTMGVNMDVCFSVTALKTGGINATLACPPFSVFCETEFAAVGIEDHPNRCAPDVDLTINDCWYNITAFMAARCLGQPACDFDSGVDLVASNFSLHACASYRVSPVITLDFYGRCCATVQAEVANPVYVGPTGYARAVATAPTPSCAAQLRVEPASPTTPPSLALVVELPGQWGLRTVSVQIVSYLSPSRALYPQIPGVQIQLLFSAAGTPFLVANYPGTVSVMQVQPALRFAGQCPLLYAREAPRQPSADFFMVFNDIVDAPPDAIQLLFNNVLPNEFFYVSNIVVVNSNGTTLTFLPPAGTNLTTYVVQCAACATRYVASEILLDGM